MKAPPVSQSVALILSSSKQASNAAKISEKLKGKNQIRSKGTKESEVRIDKKKSIENRSNDMQKGRGKKKKKKKENQIHDAVVKKEIPKLSTARRRVMVVVVA